MSHYDTLETHFMLFYRDVCAQENLLPSSAVNEGLIVAHGDKCYGYREAWSDQGIPFIHGVALYLLTYVYPFKMGVRQTPHGWVPPYQWVANQHVRFRTLLDRHFPPGGLPHAR